MLRGTQHRGSPARRGSAGRPAEQNELEREASLSKPIKAEAFIPRSRSEALTDGDFAFAMTLLDVNIELPEESDPKSNREFPARLSSLSDNSLPISSLSSDAQTT